MCRMCNAYHFALIREDSQKVPFWARFRYPRRPFQSIENNNDRNYPWVYFSGSRVLTRYDQRAKKVVSDSPGLVDFAIGLVNSVLNLPDGHVKIFRRSKITEVL